MMGYSDADLKNYLAGDASDALSQDIETALGSDPELEQRLMALDVYAPAVRDVMKTIPSAARLETLMPKVPETRVKPRWFMMASSIAASVVLGVALGWSGKGYFPTDKVTWKMEVASYQALYVPETVAHLDLDPEKVIRQFKRASGALGLELPQGKLAGIEALTLSRAQVLGFKGRPLIQIVYKSTNGAPIALCIIAKKSQSAQTQISYAEMRGLASA